MSDAASNPGGRASLTCPHCRGSVPPLTCPHCSAPLPVAAEVGAEAVSAAQRPGAPTLTLSPERPATPAVGEHPLTRRSKDAVAPAPGKEPRIGVPQPAETPGQEDATQSDSPRANPGVTPNAISPFSG